MQQASQLQGKALSEPVDPAAPLAADCDERLLFRVGLLLSVAILAVIAWPMLRGFVYTLDDLGDFHLPMRAFYAKCLAGGYNFNWIPSIYCGFYLQGDGQVGMYHPLHRTLYGTLSLTNAFNVELFLSYPILLGGMFFLLRRMGLKRDASIFGAMLFAFSGFSLLHFVHMQAVATIAHLPWILIAIDVALHTNKGGRAALANLAVAALTASQVLLGYPQYVWMSAFVEGLFVVYLWPRRALGAVGMLAVAKAVGVLMGAVQLLPTYDALTHSERILPGLYPNNRLSLPPVNLVQLVAPYIFQNRIVMDEPLVKTHEYGVYDGGVALALFVFLALAVRRLDARRRRIALAALLLAVLGTALVLGRYGLVYPLLSKLPLVGLFRAPCRYLVVVHLALAVGAAVTFDAMRAAATRRDRLVSRWSWALLVLPAASIAALLFAGWPLQMPAKWALLSKWAESGTLPLVAGPVIVTAATILVIAASRGIRLAFVMLLVFAAADHAFYGLSYVWRKPPTTIAGLIDSAPINRAGELMTGSQGTSGPARPPGDGEFYRIEAKWTLHDIPTLKGFLQTSGYVGLMPQRVLDYRTAEALRLACTRWQWQMAQAYWPDKNGKMPPDRLYVEDVPRPMPQARLVARAVVASNAARALKGVDIETTAVVDQELGLEKAPAGAARVTLYLPGDIRVTTVSPSRQLLVLSESWHAGWRARMDDKPVQVVRAYGDFLGVAVDRGRHYVSFEFAPRSLAVGALASKVGVAFALAVFIATVAVAWYRA